MLDISTRLYLLIVFLALFAGKCAGFNSVIDDLLILVVGVMIGKEVLADAVKETREKIKNNRVE